MLKYLPLEEAARANGLTAQTLKIKFVHAKRQAIPLPSRVRIGRRFLYDVESLNLWLVSNADQLRRSFPKIEPEKV